MNRLGRNLLIWLGIGLWAVLSGVGANLAGDDDGTRIERKGKTRIVIVDDDGNRHEEVYEFDGDHPRPFLGVTLDRVDGGGARVDTVIEDTAAERAGLREGDIIFGFDGAEIKSPRDLSREVLRSQPGDRVELELIRDGEPEVLTVEIGERDDGFGHHGFDAEAFEEKMELLHERLENMDLDFDFDFDFDTGAFENSMEQLHERLENLDFDFELDDLNFDFDVPHGRHHDRIMRSARPVLGVELVDATPELREHLGSARDEGVLVGRVMDGMPAAAAGVRVGDLIVAVDGESIEDAHDLRRALRDRQGRTFYLDVVRDGGRTTLSVEIPEVDEDDVRDSGRRRLERRRGVSASDRS